MWNLGNPNKFGKQVWPVMVRILLEDLEWLINFIISKNYFFKYKTVFNWLCEFVKKRWDIELPYKQYQDVDN